jgi:hypothetical protein
VIRHTPGPWRVHADGETVFSESPIHRVANCTTKSVGLYQRQRRANARLIAAAPELLELLQESQISIGGDWRERRDSLVARIEGTEVML